MNVRQKEYLFVVTLVTAASTAVLGQTLVGAPDARRPAAAPDFSGIWAHPMLGFENPLSGSGPIRNLSRTTGGASNFDKLVGDYSNPILKPNAAAVLKQRGEISASGRAFPDPDNQCLRQPVPYIFWNFEIMLLQQPHQVTIVYPHDMDYRQVRLNASHPAKVIPDSHGDSVGHYEGDTLVIDTIGVKVGPYTMIDRFGTPYTEALRVVERYKLLDYATAKAAQDRGLKEWPRVGGASAAVPSDNKSRGLQLEFTVEDPGVFTAPWSAVITYLPAAHDDWQERVCAENVAPYYAVGNFYSDPGAHIATALRPDF